MYEYCSSPREQLEQILDGIRREMDSTEREASSVRERLNSLEERIRRLALLEDEYREVLERI